MYVLVLFLALLDDRLDGLHLSFYELIGLWEPGRWWGGEVVYWMLHLWTKSRNSFPTYCGPSLLTISSGRPKSDTVFLISSLTTLLVVACRGETIRVL